MSGYKGKRPNTTVRLMDPAEALCLHTSTLTRQTGSPCYFMCCSWTRKLRRVPCELCYSA
jgi:hypothetical protein